MDASAQLLAIAHATAREQLPFLGGARYADRVQAVPDKLAALRSAVAVLEGLAAPYALIGGLAVGIRSGIPRATLDIDFAVDSRAARSDLVQAMKHAGYQLIGEFPHSINFLHPSGEPVQFALDAGFDVMIERAEAVSFGDSSVRVVTKEDLIAMKRRAASDPARRRSKALRDEADVALLLGDIPKPGEGW